MKNPAVPPSANEVPGTEKNAILAAHKPQTEKLSDTQDKLLDRDKI